MEKIAISIPSNDKRFERAMKNLRWINLELLQIDATLRKTKLNQIWWHKMEIT